VVSYSSARGKLLRSAWHLIRLEVAQCGRTGRDAVLKTVADRHGFLITSLLRLLSNLAYVKPALHHDEQHYCMYA